MSYPLPVPSPTNGYHLSAPIDNPGQPNDGLCFWCGGDMAVHYV